MEKVEVAPPVTAKPAEYQPVPTAEINANYPVSWHDISKSCNTGNKFSEFTCAHINPWQAC
jgi:hypothetical protein